MKTILIVDDEDTICETLAEVLGEEGYRCLTAANGHEALERMTATRPDLVICDVMMPVLDGREMLHAMRSTPALASILVVMTSAAPSALADETASYSALVRKPFRLDTIIDLVVRLVGGPEP